MFSESIINQVRVQIKVVLDTLHSSYCIFYELLMLSLRTWQPVFKYTFLNESLKDKDTSEGGASLSMAGLRGGLKRSNSQDGWNIYFLFSVIFVCLF